MVEVTMRQRLEELILKHGSLRKVGLVLEIDHGYLSMLRDGLKSAPSEKVLRKLGLRRVVKFVRRTSTGCHLK